MERKQRPAIEAERPANENSVGPAESLDPRVLRIAEAIGRQLARELDRRPSAANDNVSRR